MNTSPVLVTGAAGFAGSHLVEHLTASGDAVVGWSRREVDLLDREAVRERIRGLRPSAIYHCAGAPQVAHSWEDTVRPLASNVLATHHLLDAVRRAGLKCRVLIPGSATVYRSSLSPLTEDDPVAPSSPYAVSKLAQEQLGVRACAEDGIDVLLTRSFNHTGPRQTPGFAAPAMARQLALIESGRVEPTIKVGNLEPQRDLTDVRDVVRAYRLLMERGQPGTPYNICSGTAHPIRDVLDGLRQRVRMPISIEVDPARLRANDLPILLGSPAKLHHDTGWKPAISFDRMLDDLLAYWRDVIRTQPQEIDP